MRTILCFAHGREGDWEALCADFDLAVQGATFNEVREEDPATAERLLNRHAPLHVTLAWTLRVLASAWGSAVIASEAKQSRAKTR